MNAHIMTFGCTANQNDSEIMAGLLSRAGIVMVTNKENADVIIVNTCIVKGATERQMKKIVKETAGKKTIITGCMPEVELDEIQKLNPNASIVSTHHVTEIVNAVKKLVEGKKVVLVGLGGKEKIGLSRIPTNPVVTTIQINEGCVGNCAYCIVKNVKPILRSYSERMILKSAEQGLANGAKEVWITSQDTAAYGIERNGKSELPDLIKSIVGLPGKFKLRVGMMNPDNVLSVLDLLVEAFDSDKVFKFIHIPVQAGSDKVLKDMNRKYTSSEFKKVVSAFRLRYPDMTIATDVICGFPGESEEEFEETLELVKLLDVVNISRFTTRPGTTADKMKQHPTRVTKDRSRLLTSAFLKIAEERNKKWIGREVEVLFDQKGKDESTLGRDENYRMIAVEGKHRIGSHAIVQIIGANAHYLTGKFI